MLKKTILVASMSIWTLTTFAQDAKKEAETVKTKMDEFTSKMGVIRKFTDSKLPNLKTSFGSAETRVRKIESGTASGFFYQITKEGQYSSSTASIEYSDLLDVLKAVTALKSEVGKDVVANPDYLENKFVSKDGFEVGYYVDKGKASWFVKLEKFGSNNTLFVSGVDAIESAFTDAKNRIDELRK